MPVHYSAYQPSHDPKGHYCDDIPVAGEKTILVVDIAEEALRVRPTGLEVKGLDADGNQKVLLRTAVEPRPAGVIEAEVRFERPGRYVAALISPDGHEAQAPIEMFVGTVNWEKLVKRVVPYIALGVLLSWLGMRARRRWMMRRAIRSGSKG